MNKQQEVRAYLASHLSGVVIPEHVWEVFFLKTDKGKDPTLEGADNKLLEMMLQAHGMIAWIVNEWGRDFQTGVLFLSDFNGECMFMKRLALKMYAQAMGKSQHFLSWRSRWLSPDPILSEGEQ